MIRRVPSKQRNTLVKRERDPQALTRLACCCCCAGCCWPADLFMRAGGISPRSGWATKRKSCAMRSTRAREDQRRLTLEREAAASPARLELAARRLGMQPMQPAQIDPLKQRSDVASLKPAARRSWSPRRRRPPKAAVKHKVETGSQGSIDGSTT